MPWWVWAIGVVVFLVICWRLFLSWLLIVSRR